VKEQKKGEKAAGAEGEKAAPGPGKSPGDDKGDSTYIVGVDDHKPDDAQDKQDREDEEKARGADGRGTPQLAQDGRQYPQEHPKQGAAGAYAPRGTAAPAGAAAAPRVAKNGKPLTLRFVLPSGPGSDTLSKVADRITTMLGAVGIATEITKVPDDSYFRDHIAAGQYDLALYSWPSSAYPATDARPVYAKPVPAADGSLNVQQNYTRVGTDQVDQLFAQAIATLDEGEEKDLVRKADARIWATAGSIPLYQRPQLVATRRTLVNVGAFGFQTPVYEDMGFLKKGAKLSPSPSS
jgi:peptide/nickel transport system substrate-binding protein